MVKNSENYQSKAINALYDFYFSKSKNGKMILATGLGKIKIISSSVEKLMRKSGCKILILGLFNEIINKIEFNLRYNLGDDVIYDSLLESKDRGVFLAKYRDILNNEVDYSKFDLIICLDSDKLDREYNYPFLQNNLNTKCLLIFTGISEMKEYSNYECVFKYTLIDVLESGYIVDKVDENFVVSFVYMLLNKLNYKNIEIGPFLNQKTSVMRPDIIATKNGNNYIFEIKFYRELEITNNILDNAVKSVKNYQDKLDNQKYSFILVMLCLVDKDYKKEVYEKYNIIIWDVSNLLYLTSEFEDIYNLLVRAIPYFSSKIKREQPLKFEYDLKEAKFNKNNRYEEFKYRLDNCPFGNEENFSKEYEEICNEMIKYLFETEFFQMYPQHYTYDKVFRFDLICSLKGTTSFWNFLIDFYRTRFVVFEYKNYSEKLKQNSIFVTEKYLLTSALRNVVFIISRKGFDINATAMALSCLKNDNKLIIELTDEDMLSMIKIKEDGEEASDYLLSKVESILMSISK